MLAQRTCLELDQLEDDSVKRLVNKEPSSSAACMQRISFAVSALKRESLVLRRKSR